MELHVGRAVSNFYRAEHDPLVSDVIVADGYQIKEGMVSVPIRPALGWRSMKRRSAGTRKFGLT